MLFLIVWYLLIAIFAHSWGHLCLTAIQTQFPNSSENNPAPLYLKIGLGLGVITVLTAYINFFSGLNGSVLGVLAGINLCVALFYQKALLADWHLGLQRLRQMPVWVQGLLFLLVVMTLFLATLPSVDVDEADYHAQFIAFAQAGPVKTGLAHLNTRLGFNNHWFLTNALLNGAYFGIGTSNRLNGFLHLVLLCTTVPAVAHFRRNNWPAFLRVGLLLCTAIPFNLVIHLPSPSTEMATAYFGWLLLIWLFDRTVAQKIYVVDNQTIAVTTLCLVLPTLKLSIFPALLLPLFYVGQSFWFGKTTPYGGHIKKALLIMAIGFIVFAPWFARNIVLTGYPVYPVPGLEWQDVAWKVPQTQVEEEARIIRQDPVSCLQNGTRVMPSNAKEMLWCWWQSNLRFYDALLYLLFLISPFWWRRAGRTGPAAVRIAQGLFVCIVLCSISAPSPRFAYWALMPLAIWVLYNLFEWIKLSRFVFPVLLGGLLMGYGLAVPLHLKYFQNKPLYPAGTVPISSHNLILPVPYPLPTGNMENIHGHWLLVEPPTHCWDRCDCMPVRKPLGKYPEAIDD